MRKSTNLNIKIKLSVKNLKKFEAKRNNLLIIDPKKNQLDGSWFRVAWTN